MRARFLTALALIPPVLAAVFCTSPWPILTLLVLVVLIGIGEIRRLTGQTLSVVGLPILSLGLLTIAQQSYAIRRDLGSPQWVIAIAGLALFVLAVASLFCVPAKATKVHLLALLFGGWLIGPSAALFALHQSPLSAETWLFESPVLLAIVPLWAGDTAAIFAGKAFGKHKLAPTISPKKTVEGAVANLIACVFAAWGLGAWIGFPLPQSLACGVAAGIFGQAGDLFESWIKRRADMKDSGTLLPGHGGVLDRIDSILFTAPIVALVLLFWK